MPYKIDHMFSSYVYQINDALFPWVFTAAIHVFYAIG